MIRRPAKSSSAVSALSTGVTSRHFFASDFKLVSISSQLHFGIGYIIILATDQEHISLFKKFFEQVACNNHTPFIT